MLKTNYDIIIFDCDGVLLDSNLLKIEVMRKTLEEYDVKKVESFLSFMRKNFGTSRYRLIQNFLENFESKFSEERYNELIERFGSLCSKEYLNSKTTVGCCDFLTNVKASFYIASGSDQDELRKTFHHKNLYQYFVEIYGSPEKKSEILRRLQKEHETSKILFIGDSVKDFEAKKDTNIDFIFVTDNSADKDNVINFAKSNKINHFQNLSELYNYGKTNGLFTL